MREAGEKLKNVALVGNPNSGKSTIFNQLTGLRQKTGNFPGVTVDVKEGRLRFPSGKEAILSDLPGTYSLYPTSSDEKIVAAVLANPLDAHYPDAIVYVADATHLEKHLLLLTQLLDLGLPVLLALNMADMAAEIGIRVNALKLAERLGIPVVSVSGRTGENIQKLIAEIEKLLLAPRQQRKPFYPLTELEKQIAEATCLNLGTPNTYQALLIAHSGRVALQVVPLVRKGGGTSTQILGTELWNAENFIAGDHFTWPVGRGVAAVSAGSTG
jgi:ferrous iron transport protein B